MDGLIFQYIHNLAGKFILLDLPVIFLAQYLPYLLGGAFVALIFANKHWPRRLYFIFLSALSLLMARGVVTEVIRFFYFRPRPFLVLNFQALINQPTSAAFPSGHAVVFFILAAVIFFMNKKWFYYFLAGAILNSLARVYVGVHWPADVLAGAILGVLTVLFFERFLAKPKNQFS